jgi:hypothetical protein
MQRQDRVPAEAELEEPDLFSGSLNSVQEMVAAWMVAATIGLAAIFLL